MSHNSTKYKLPTYCSDSIELGDLSLGLGDYHHRHHTRQRVHCVQQAQELQEAPTVHVSYLRHITKALIHAAAPACEHRHVVPLKQLGSLKDGEDQEIDSQYLHKTPSQPDDLQVRPVSATDLDIAYKVSGTYLCEPSFLLDIQAQNMQQRIHKKTSVLQSIVVLAHDIAKIEQLSINIPRVGPEKRQKENRYDGIITPLIAIALVLLHPLQPVSVIGTSLVSIRDSITKSVVYGVSTDSIKILSTDNKQTQSVLIYPENLLETRHLHHHPNILYVELMVTVINSSKTTRGQPTEAMEDVQFNNMVRVESIAGVQEDISLQLGEGSNMLYDVVKQAWRPPESSQGFYLQVQLSIDFGPRDTAYLYTGSNGFLRKMVTGMRPNGRFKMDLLSTPVLLQAVRTAYQEYNEEPVKGDLPLLSQMDLENIRHSWVGYWSINPRFQITSHCPPEITISSAALLVVQLPTHLYHHLWHVHVDEHYQHIADPILYLLEQQLSDDHPQQLDLLLSYPVLLRRQDVRQSPGQLDSIEHGHDHQHHWAADHPVVTGVHCQQQARDRRIHGCKDLCKLKKMVKVNMHKMIKMTDDFKALEVMVKGYSLATRNSASYNTTPGYNSVPYLDANHPGNDGIPSNRLQPPESREHIWKGNQLGNLQHDLAIDLEAKLAVDLSVSQGDNMHRRFSVTQSATRAQVCASDGPDQIQIKRQATDDQQLWVMNCPHPEEPEQHIPPRHDSDHHPHQVPGSDTVQFQGVVSYAATATPKSSGHITHCVSTSVLRVLSWEMQECYDQLHHQKLGQNRYLQVKVYTICDKPDTAYLHLGAACFYPLELTNKRRLMELHKFILLQTLSKSLTSSPRSTATAQKQGQLQTTCTPCRLSHKGEVQHHATSKDAIRDTDICKEPAKRHMDDWQQSEVEGADVDPEKENIRNEDIEIVTHLIICLIKTASPLNLSSTSNKEIHVNIVHSIENVYHKQTKGQEVLEDHMREVAIDDDQTLQETEDEAANIHENHHKEKQEKEDNTTLIDDDVCQFPTSLAIPVKEKFLRKALNNNNSHRLGTGSGQSQVKHLPEALDQENGQGQHCLLASSANEREDPGEGLIHAQEDSRVQHCLLASSPGIVEVVPKEEIEQHAEDGSEQHAEICKSTAYNSAAAAVPAVPLVYNSNTVHSYSCLIHYTTIFKVAEYARLQLEHSGEPEMYGHFHHNGHSARHLPVTLITSSSPTNQLFSTKFRMDQLELEHGCNNHRELILLEPGQQLAMQLHHPLSKQRDLTEHQLQLEVKPVGEMGKSDTGCNGYRTYLPGPGPVCVRGTNSVYRLHTINNCVGNTAVSYTGLLPTLCMVHHLMRTIVCLLPREPVSSPMDMSQLLLRSSNPHHLHGIQSVALDTKLLPGLPGTVHQQEYHPATVIPETFLIHHVEEVLHHQQPLLPHNDHVPGSIYGLLQRVSSCDDVHHHHQSERVHVYCIQVQTVTFYVKPDTAYQIVRSTCTTLKESIGMSNNSKPWHVLDMLNISSSHHIIRHRLAADEVLNVVRVHKGNCQDTTAAVDLLIVNSTAHMLLKFIPKLGWQVLETSSSKLCIMQVRTSLIQHVGHNLHHLQQLLQQHCYQEVPSPPLQCQGHRQGKISFKSETVLGHNLICLRWCNFPEDEDAKGDVTRKVITEKSTYAQAHNINIMNQFTACIWDCLPQYSIGSLLVVFDILHLHGTTCTTTV